MLWLRLGDLFFSVFHLALVLFNLFGWMWQQSRKLHLATMAAAAFSWTVLGLFYGTGYCICTDLHWRIRAALGTPIRSSSYLQFLIENLTGWRLSTTVLNPACAVVFVLLLFTSVFLNWRDAVAKRHKTCETI